MAAGVVSVEEPCEPEGEEASAAAAFLSDLLPFGFGLVGLEVVVDPAAAAAALGLGLKPGKALPWTSWLARTTGGSLAQYEAFASGGGRDVLPIRGYFRRGRLQLSQIWRSDSDLEGLLVEEELSLPVLEGLASLDVEVVSFMVALSLTSPFSAFSGTGTASLAASSVGPPSKML